MSFSITVKVADGAASISELIGTPPDGTWHITGHSDENYQSLGVSQVAPPHAAAAAVNASWPARPAPTT